jgi:hypothetical protein
MTSSTDAPLRYHLRVYRPEVHVTSHVLISVTWLSTLDAEAMSSSHSRLNLIFSARGGPRWKLLDKLFFRLNGSLLLRQLNMKSCLFWKLAIHPSLILTLWTFCLLRQGWRIRNWLGYIDWLQGHSDPRLTKRRCLPARLYGITETSVSAIQEYTVSQKRRCLLARLYGVTETSVSDRKNIWCHRNVGVCSQDYTVSQKHRCLPERLYGVTETSMTACKTIRCHRPQYEIVTAMNIFKTYIFILSVFLLYFLYSHTLSFPLFFTPSCTYFLSCFPPPTFPLPHSCCIFASLLLPLVLSQSKRIRGEKTIPPQRTLVPVLCQAPDGHSQWICPLTSTFQHQPKHRCLLLPITAVTC